VPLGNQALAKAIGSLSRKNDYRALADRYAFAAAIRVSGR
jgi:hypothetical protein